MHVREIGLGEVRFHPHVAAHDERHRDAPGRHVLTGLRRLADGAGKRRAHLDPREIEARLRELGERRAVAGVALDRQVDAAEGFGDALPVLLQRGDLVGREVRRLLRFVELGGGDEVPGDEVGLALLVPFREGVLRARESDLGLLFAIARLECKQVRACLCELRFRLGDRDLIRRRIDAKQHLARTHGLVLLHEHGLDGAGDVGADRHHVRLHVGVVRLDEASALQVEHRGDERGDRGHHQQKQRANDTTA